MRLRHIERYREVCGQYPALNKAATVMEQPPADIIGRDISELRRGIRNPEKANVVLLAEPGSGKTAYVQGFAYDEDTVDYYLVLDVNMERLIEPGVDKDSALIVGAGTLLEEASKYSREQNVIVVLFLDEFHKLMEMSPNLMESLKPKLEKSAMNGFRLIAATTFEEYNKYVAKNRALDQRFLQIKLTELPKYAVISILKNRAKQKHVYHMLEDGILDAIYTECKRILISNAQPRASVDTFNSMLSEILKREYMKQGKLYKEYYTPEEMGFNSDKVISRPLLKRVIKRSHGLDIDNEVNVTEVIDALKSRLYNQDNAIESVVHLLEMAAQGFGELDRPKMSFISTGATGTGKSLRDSEPIPAPVPDGYIRNGELKAGDYVYNKYGKSIRVTGVYPQGVRTVYRVTLTDGRQMDCARDHLWTYKDCILGTWNTATTETLMGLFMAEPHREKPNTNRFALPSNSAIEREPKEYGMDPYILGIFLGQAASGKHPKETLHDMELCYLRQIAPGLALDNPNGLFIPDCYKFGSIRQRQALLCGIFDTAGHIGEASRFPVFCTSLSRQLMEDIQEVLWSVGIQSVFSARVNKGWSDLRDIYCIYIKDTFGAMESLFGAPHKRNQLKELKANGKREKKFDTIAIKSIEKLDEKAPMTCIMVDDPEHLYLAGKGHIVTHNTELAKIVSETMRLPLKRFDMSRYASPEDAGAFADDLFAAVWATPNAYILIDEVEKSSKKAMNILLQVLDDARLSDSVNPDRVASFSGAIINLTTNLGSEVYQNMARHLSNSAEADVELVYKSLTESEVFETAVLGRLDAIVPFHPLPVEALERIAQRTLNDVVETAETQKRRIIVSEDVIPYIVKDRTSNDTERGGARDAKRNVRNLVVQVLAHYLTYAKQEVPVILYIKGKPRFKHTEIADPLNAHVALYECHSVETVQAVLGKLSTRLGKPLQDKGLYLPNTVPLEKYLQDIAKLALTGYNKFKSVVDGEEVTIVGI